MKSRVANAARAAQQTRIQAMSPVDRLRHSLQMGQRAAEMMAAATGISPKEARRRAKAMVAARPISPTL